MTGRTEKLAGQAMTEFVVAIVAFVAIIAGLLQVGTLCRAKVETMIRSRALAGANAINNGYDPIPFPFVGTWSDGRDRLSYTEDDVVVPSSGDPFMAVATRAASTPINYPRYTPPYVQNNALADFIDFNGGDYSATRGWAKGIDFRDVEIDFAVQKLIVDQDVIVISSATYLPTFSTTTIP
jgi:hypothetical protein